MSEIVIWILFFVFYLIFQVLGKKKRPKPQTLPPEATGGEDGSSRPATLEDALREIQEALRQPGNQPGNQPREQPRSLPSTASEPVRPLPAPPRKLPQRATSSDFRSLEAPPREMAGPEFQRRERTNLERTHWEEPLARRTEVPRPVEVRPSTSTPLIKSSLIGARTAGIPSPTTQASLLRASIADDVRDPKRLQKAWLLKEVFDDPAYKRLIKPGS
ncbi:MAG: hypothetical protein SH809_09140 [Rhodothermales bacterium]|nr:hypothetical protein [Rhodothermales bacterium]